jgi:3-deoxy-D-manno-octulosonate 8-phosphate phosphatase (KDO 8-P phosphatase)
VIDTQAARRVRLLGLDVDGVLTNNAVYLGLADGERVEFKQFDIRDGLGIHLARRAGLLVAWISGRFSEATSLRAAELNIDELIQEAAARKVPAMVDLLARRGIGWDEVAFVGDDLSDLPVMRRVALPIAVANAVKEVREAADYVTRSPGGAGAVREVVEVLLRVRDQWDDVLQSYVREREECA